MSGSVFYEFQFAPKNEKISSSVMDSKTTDKFLSDYFGQNVWIYAVTKGKF
jgi:hypothetical protein